MAIIFSGSASYLPQGTCTASRGHTLSFYVDSTKQHLLSRPDLHCRLELELPPEYSCSLVPHHTSNLLICGWGGDSFMAALLAELDHGGLPPGSRVTLLNERADAGVLLALAVASACVACFCIPQVLLLGFVTLL